jgi:hypothetical protein
MIGDAVLRRGLSDPKDEDRYLEALNLCFPDWGGRAMFDWCFSRPGAGRVPDILRLFVDGRAVAGNAVSYRRVAVRGGAELTAGIVTGSWTLPEARGAGAFRRLLAASREQIASRGGALLLAFVRAENTSCRGLLSVGADLTPTFYCRSEDTVALAPADIQEPAREWNADLFQRDREETRFLYSAEEWAAQFVNRPGTVCVLEGPGRWLAVVERTDGFDRVHALAAAPPEWTSGIDALMARAVAAGRRLFVFTTSPAEADMLRRKRFAIVDGFLGVLAADATALEHAFGVAYPQGELRGLFSDPESPWHLGQWALQNGDRM